jgi:DNA-binding NarL/FixJ family response regulator
MNAMVTTELNRRMDGTTITMTDTTGNLFAAGANLPLQAGRGNGAGDRAPIRLLLVDDQAHVRRGLRMRLALEDDVIVVGDAGDAETAFELAEACSPDVVIMDVELPGMDGIAATGRLRHAKPGLAIVMLSLHDDPDTQARASAAGAAAFVPKHRMEGPLLAAIRLAADRE